MMIDKFADLIFAHSKWYIDREFSLHWKKNISHFVYSRDSGWKSLFVHEYNSLKKSFFFCKKKLSICHSELLIC